MSVLSQRDLQINSIRMNKMRLNLSELHEGIKELNESHWTLQDPSCSTYFRDIEQRFRQIEYQFENVFVVYNKLYNELEESQQQTNEDHSPIRNRIIAEVKEALASAGSRSSIDVTKSPGEYTVTIQIN